MLEACFQRSSKILVAYASNLGGVQSILQISKLFILNQGPLVSECIVETLKFGFPPFSTIFALHT